MSQPTDDATEAAAQRLQELASDLGECEYGVLADVGAEIVRALGRQTQAIEAQTYMLEGIMHALRDRT